MKFIVNSVDIIISLLLLAPLVVAQPTEPTNLNPSLTVSTANAAITKPMVPSQENLPPTLEPSTIATNQQVDEILPDQEEDSGKAKTTPPSPKGEGDNDNQLNLVALPGETQPKKSTVPQNQPAGKTSTNHDEDEIPDHQETNEIATTADKSINLEEQLQILKLQSAILFVQQLIQLKHYQKELVILKQEKAKWQLKNELRQEQTLEELSQLEAEKKKLLLENQLYSARQKQQLAELNEIKIRLELENQVQEQEKKKLLSQLEVERDQLTIQNAIAEEKTKQKTLQLQLDTAQLEFERAKLEFEKNKRDLETAELADKISAREQQEIWENQVNKPIKYLKNPIVDGFLVLTDRQIKLNDVIYPGTADYVAERIYYFNNKTEEYPIFLIFDTCYGGSVMEGARIIEAMLNSRAPVYVVVKSLAASMAAVITTIAKHSYAYPHAIILHHQIVLEDYGGSNQREIEEKFKMAAAWTKRIMQPVVDKMGVSLEQFVKMMYEANSQGNWYEFADEAVKRKWVGQVVQGVRDVSVVKPPADEDAEEIIVIQ